MGAADNSEAKGGAAIGILMLETRFPRRPGDIGNPASFDFPVLYGTVAGADPETAVRGDARRLLPNFIAAGRDLVAQGAAGLTTSCGFLAPFQNALADGCGVAVAASSLMQIPLVQRLLPDGRRAGVLTADAEALGRGDRARNAPAGLRHAPPAALVPCRAGGRCRCRCLYRRRTLKRKAADRSPPRCSRTSGGVRRSCRATRFSPGAP